MYAAEGSDWFWWYGDDQNSGDDGYFDAAYRELLGQVFDAIGEPRPRWVDVPIVARPGVAPELAEVLRALPAETVGVGLCGPYPLRGAFPDGAPALLVYGDEVACQAAAASALLGADAPGSLPV